MSNLRVLIVSQHFPPEKTANASRTYETAFNLNKLGMETMVFSPHPTYPHSNFNKIWKFRESKEVDGIKLVNLWSWQPSSTDPGFLSRIAYYLIFPLHAMAWALLYMNRYDIIITSNPPIFTGITGLFSKIILRKKWIIDTRDLWVDASISLGFLKKGSIFEKISKKYEKLCYLKTDLILAATEDTRKKISEKYVADKRIEVTTNGVDTDNFYCTNSKKKQQIVFMGNVGHAMDLENCIVAMHSIIKHHKLKLVIVGDGDKKEELEKFVKLQGLNEVVKFKGLVKREKIPEILSQSLIGIAPTKELEALEYVIPVKIYEYMACKLPYVACGVGEIVKLTGESGAGIVVPNSPDAIADSIIDIIDNPEKLTEMGEKGRIYVKNKYNRKNIVLKLKEDIETLLYSDDPEIYELGEENYARGK